MSFQKFLELEQALVSYIRKKTILSLGFDKIFLKNNGTGYIENNSNYAVVDGNQLVVYLNDGKCKHYNLTKNEQRFLNSFAQSREKVDVYEDTVLFDQMVPISLIESMLPSQQISLVSFNTYECQPLKQLLGYRTAQNDIGLVLKRLNNEGTSLLSLT
jgi:hypothetical protein